MSEESAAATLGKVVLGGAVGFALFLVGTGLGLGRGGSGRGGGTSSAPPGAHPPLPGPPSSPSLPAPQPPRPRDDRRLSFVMIEPRVVGGTMGFRLRTGEPSKIYALEELVARVRDGGRTDVELRASGAVTQGAWDEALTHIKRAGLTVWLIETSPGLPARVGRAWPEDTRGQYKRGFQ